MSTQQDSPSEVALVLNDLAPVLGEYLTEELGFIPEFTLVVWGEKGVQAQDSGKFVSNLGRNEHQQRLHRLLEAVKRASLQ